MQDRFGLVPPAIRHNYERAEMVDRQLDAAVSLHRALTALDPRLDLVFVSDRADPEFGVTPGRWHVVRKNEAPAPDSYMAITGRNGEYREPDHGVIHELQRRDMWTQGQPDLDAQPAAKRRYDSLHNEQARDEVLADVRAGSRVAGEGGMTRRAWGRK